jgi:aryl-alcohol dehydrogenase-like predicted oxidoreductase
MTVVQTFPSATSVEQLQPLVRAADLRLTEDDLATLNIP